MHALKWACGCARTERCLCSSSPVCFVVWLWIKYKCRQLEIRKMLCGPSRHTGKSRGLYGMKLEKLPLGALEQGLLFGGKQRTKAVSVGGWSPGRTWNGHQAIGSRKTGISLVRSAPQIRLMIGNLTEHRKGGEILEAPSLWRNLDMPVGASVPCGQQPEQSWTS